LEKKNAEHCDRIGLSGEKERQIFPQIDQSDMIWEKEHNHYVRNDRSTIHLTWTTAALDFISFVPLNLVSNKQTLINGNKNDDIKCCCFHFFIPYLSSFG